VDFGATPLLKTDCPAGRHTLKISLKNYADTTVPLDLKPNETIKISAELKPRAFLSVKTEPSGASILLGNKEIGNTDFQETVIPAGKHALRICKADYDTVAKEITIPTGEKTSVEEKLVYQYARLRIRAFTEEARWDSSMKTFVYFNDALKDSTPCMLDRITPGNYRLKLTCNTYEDVLQNVTLPRNQLLDVVYTMKRSQQYLAEKERQKKASIAKVKGVFRWGFLGAGAVLGGVSLLKHFEAQKHYDAYSSTDLSAEAEKEWGLFDEATNTRNVFLIAGGAVLTVDLALWVF
jgi:hypothetical protein